MEQLMINSTDLTSYNPPIEIQFGTLRSTTDFFSLADIGDGSSSSVFKAKDKKDNKIVALKHLKPSNPILTLTREIFREITILSSLNHDNIIKLIEVIHGADVNSLCLVLEYCPVALDQWIKFQKTDINIKVIKCILKQMLSGLNHMHKSFMVHRDIKPGNLMISEKGVLKIVDFGLSRRFTPTTRMTSPHVFTLWYQPPEILFRAPSYCNKVDIWAVGCIFAELFRRQPLFKGESEISQINLMIDVIGTPTPNNWSDISRCEQTKNLQLKSQPFYKLASMFTAPGSQDAVSLMSQLLVYDPKSRPSADQILEDPYLQQAPHAAESIPVPKEMFEMLSITL